MGDETQRQGRDLRRALYHGHRMDRQLLEYTRANATGILALLDVLISKGVLTAEEVAASFKTSQPKVDDVRKTKYAGPKICPVPDDAPRAEMDCAERYSACGAVCCSTYDVHLTEAEVRSGRYRWDIADPYRLERTPEGRCTYLGTDDRCGIWEHRPAVCRAYSCKNDKLIWFDFEKKLSRRQYRPPSVEPPAPEG